MSRKADHLVRVCDGWDDYPPARRCLSALRRSGRDSIFNVHVAYRQLEIEVAKLLTPPIAALDRFLRRFA